MALNLSSDDNSDLSALGVRVNEAGVVPTRPVVQSYLGSLADSYGLPQEVVHAVAQTQSGFAWDTVRTNRPASDAAQLGTDSQRYGVMQVSDEQIGKKVRDADGTPFQIGENIMTDWRANADAGVALLAQHYRVAEMEQPYSTLEERAQQAYSGYSAGNSNRDRYLITLPYSNAPAHPGDRAFLQNLLNAPSNNEPDQASEKPRNNAVSQQSTPPPDRNPQPQPTPRPDTSVPTDFDPTSGSVQVQRVFPDEQQPVPVRARMSGVQVVVEYSDGAQETRAGGSRSWRNNNPGNIRPGPFADSHGAVGEAGGFAVFPDERAGQQAIVALLRTPPYQNLTVSGALARYAPPNENNTPAYQQFVQNAAGINGATKMNDLEDRQLDAVASAIRRLEGWNAGSLKVGGPE